jgi:hypothetical protein
MDMKELERAHEHSYANRQELMESEKCGCFFCLEIFSPSEITTWELDDNDVESVAVCPYCQADSVLGDRSGFPIKRGFLETMRLRWFSCC